MTHRWAANEHWCWHTSIEHTLQSLSSPAMTSMGILP